MAKLTWEIKLAAALVVLSAALYGFHFSVFHDMHHILIYLVGDIAFVPIEVLLVTVIIHRLLDIRERRHKLEKMNIVIGAFFSEVGTSFLTSLSDCDPNLDEIRRFMIVENDWNDEEFEMAFKKLRGYSYDLEPDKVDLRGIKAFLVGKREFMVRLLENPMLLEHESFTKLLQAVFHVIEEMDSRKSFDGLPQSDLEHLRGDLRRSYTLLVMEWLDYMRHLKANYPYLYSLAMRLNPFDLESDIIVS